MPEPVHIATVVRSRGNRGEVLVDCPAGHPERWVGLTSVLLGEGPGALARRAIQRSWLHGGRLVVHFAGVDDIGTARSLVGRCLFLDERELPPLPPDTWYTFELVGARVIDMSGRPLGCVVDTEAGPGQDRLVVETPEGRRVEIPMVRSILREVDRDARTIRLDPPVGLVTGEPEAAVPSPPGAGGRGNRR